MLKTRVYVAGPMSQGDKAENLANALRAMRSLMEAGKAGRSPQLSFFAEPFMGNTDHAGWLSIDLPWVSVADAVLRLPGAGAGADMEVNHARARGIPVVSSVGDLIEFFAK